jgi:hypothetical protein
MAKAANKKGNKKCNEKKRFNVGLSQFCCQSLLIYLGEWGL